MQAHCIHHFKPVPLRDGGQGLSVICWGFVSGCFIDRCLLQFLLLMLLAAVPWLSPTPISLTVTSPKWHRQLFGQHGYCGLLLQHILRSWHVCHADSSRLCGHLQAVLQHPWQYFTRSRHKLCLRFQVNIIMAAAMDIMVANPIVLRESMHAFLHRSSCGPQACRCLHPTRVRRVTSRRVCPMLGEWCIRKLPDVQMHHTSIFKLSWKAPCHVTVEQIMSFLPLAC